MTSDAGLESHLKNLQAALLKLHPTGPEGFEGLIATLLTSITSIPFRLASSGSQFGVDGQAIYPPDGVSFEAKRYDGSIRKDSILAKLQEIVSERGRATELWVLGASCQVSTQITGYLEDFESREGIGTLILDWDETSVSPLAAALAMADFAAARFFDSQLSDKSIVTRLTPALAAVNASENFAHHERQLRERLSDPMMGLSVARAANERWLASAFNSKKHARIRFGQPLAPGDTPTTTLLGRDALQQQLRTAAFSTYNDQIVVVHGDEGHGKSWLVAQTWQSLDSRPLLFVLTPEHFESSALDNNIRDLLIKRMIVQTGQTAADKFYSKWHRTFERWSRLPPPSTPRVIVFVDGLNQRASCDWGRILDTLSETVSLLGGKLIVSVRTAYYTNRVETRLHSPVVAVPVSEWSEQERDEILVANDICPHMLEGRVAQSLRNPRLLGIALDLLTQQQIEHLHDLSVPRLLFEHLRASERDAPVSQSANAFSRELCQHAKAILNRLRDNQQDDIRVFEDELRAVAGERFFKPLTADATRYELVDEGLSFALGLAIVDILQCAHRNHRDITEAVNSVLEPINTLDLTADAVFAALSIVCCDDAYPDALANALLTTFLELQNLDEDSWLAFTALAKLRTGVYLGVIHDLCLQGGHIPNFNWIETALYSLKCDGAIWSVMAPHLKDWLRYYTLSPQRLLFKHPDRDPHEEVTAERQNKQAVIDTRIQQLSAGEATLRDTLIEKQGDLGALSELTFKLLAGQALAPFAKELMQWAFANAINPNHQTPYSNFYSLVRLNRIDWSACRTALMREWMPLEGATCSRTGQWALVHLLRVTGQTEDSDRAASLSKQLTADRPIFEGRSRHRYCDVDPCQPDSECPDNLTSTVEAFNRLDMSTVRLGVGQTPEDLLFVKAQPGLARFAPDVIIAKFRELIQDMKNRSGLPLCQGLFELHRHNALLTEQDARDLLLRDTGNERDRAADRDAYLISQYRRLLAFPLLCSEEQMTALLAPNVTDEILLDVLRVVKVLEESVYEHFIEHACETVDESTQVRMLAVGQYTATPITRKVRDLLGEHLLNGPQKVRQQALGLVAKIKDPDLVRQVVSSGWTGISLDPRGHEAWYGSLVLIEGVRLGFLSHTEALPRMTPGIYCLAAAKLDGVARKDVGILLNSAINRLASFQYTTALPDIIKPTRETDACERSLLSLAEPPPTAEDVGDFFRRMSETEEQFDERQARMHGALDRFETELDRQQANLVLDDIRLDEFQAIVDANPELAENWYTTLSQLPESQRPFLHNIALLLAYAFSATAPEKSVTLMVNFKDSQPILQMTYGRAALSLDAVVSWRSAVGEPLISVCFRRLDEALDDGELAREVLTAYQCGQGALIENYIQSRTTSEEPRAIVAGITAAGFSVQNATSEEVLDRFRNASGFIGSARAAAVYAYERNQWAAHWYDLMCNLPNAEGFWRYSILFVKVVDARFDLWEREPTDASSIFQQFWPSVDGQLKNRFERWQGKRRKTLYGDKTPDHVFVVQ